jgi:hypothetical protein
MLQLQNNTPFAADFSLFPNEDGIDSLYINVKATFKIGQQWSLVDQQPLPVQVDEYWGEPEASSIKYPSDVHIGKKNTDIIMVGSAFTPNGKHVQQLDVSLSVGEVVKTIRVFGDRQWQNGVMTHPTPFQMMPMVYERAYGGKFKQNDKVFTLDSNPVGLGFVGKRSKAEYNGLALPNLEHPHELINSPKDQPSPACFGAVAPYWPPRSNFAGTYDEHWQSECAPYLPKDFDKRFCNVACTELIYPGYLQGGESVEINHMHPKGNLVFTIPYVKLKCEVNLGDEVVKPQFNIETLLLEPNDLTISMIWRAAILCDKKLIKINTININMAR